MSRTQGKLTHRSFSIYAADGKTPVADTCLTNSVANHDVENARRLVACWNACDGLYTESLERGPSLADQLVDALNQRDSLRAVNAELIEALENIMQHIGSENHHPDGEWVTEPIHIDEVNAARAAIASARKQGEQG